jgi:hypothetical protein
MDACVFRNNASVVCTDANIARVFL